METQMIIIDNYFNENLEFKQAFEDYKKTCLKENQIEVPHDQIQPYRVSHSCVTRLRSTSSPDQLA